MSRWSDAYPDRLSDDEVLELLRNEIYKVDLDTGDITGPSGRKLSPGGSGRQREYGRVCLYSGGAKRRMPWHQLVWMAGTDSVVPTNFTVHHCDLDPSHNAFSNLLCLHTVDHKKVHDGVTLMLDESDEVPF